ncbi:MAG: hypothetical protein WC444_05585 [Candidatus Paceibacterota bacterium]
MVEIEQGSTQKIMGLILGKKQQAHLERNTVAEIHYQLCKEFNTYIPIEELNKQPIPTILNLMQIADRENKRYNAEMRKHNRKR